ncbi:MAG: hypothetical protein AAGA68_27350 [Pseudomonadota bacterium]
MNCSHMSVAELQSAIAGADPTTEAVLRIELSTRVDGLALDVQHANDRAEAAEEELGNLEADAEAYEAERDRLNDAAVELINALDDVALPADASKALAELMEVCV